MAPFSGTPVLAGAAALGPADLFPLAETGGGRDVLFDMVGDRRVVLLGESTHGSHEFYEERARLTRRLVEERGFSVVAVEADWPDAARVNRYIQGRSKDPDATSALSDFKRFPSWMWRNTDVVELVDWLRSFNASLPPTRRKVSFVGLDLYSLRASMDAVVSYLQERDPPAAARARARYGCFDHVGAEGPAYGHAVALDLMVPCEADVVAQLVELREQAGALLAADGPQAGEELFYAQQNARLVHSAERYYRIMYQGHVASWNLRDTHMAETLRSLLSHLDRDTGRTKVVVWAHNSHVGDARATELGAMGELTVGQLVRGTWGAEALLVGFTTDHGTVTAAPAWGAPATQMVVRPAPAGSYEALFHQTGLAGFVTPLSERGPAALAAPRLERAIGVVYLPRTERRSHWFTARLAEQFDAVVHLDRTSALEPLDRSEHWEPSEPPETYPSGV